MIKNPCYRIYETPNKVIAVSSFAGQTVRGVAKCNPADAFDLAKGQKLAEARCNAKVAEKRFKRAKRKCEETFKAYGEAVANHNRMVDYYNDSAAALNDAKEEVKAVVDNM